CEVAAALGFPIFATGGIGGGHRGASGDVSADLAALGRFPGMVVCSGAKSILDLPRTLEALEALSVPGGGFGPSASPACHAARPGRPRERRAAPPQPRAELPQAQPAALGLPQAVVLAVPPPADVALPREEVDRALLLAEEEAARQEITGKALTP